MIRSDSEKARWLQDPRFLPAAVSQQGLAAHTNEEVFAGLILASLDFTAHTLVI